MRTILFDQRDLHSAFLYEQGILLRPVFSAQSSLPAGEYARSPYGEVGQQMWVQERLWVSECGRYYAQSAPVAHDSLAVDVVTVDGEQWWFWGRYVPKGWGDQDPRYRYPEFAHLVAAWSNVSHTSRTGRCRFAFEVDIVDCDTSQRIQPWKGNTVRRSSQAVFRRQMPAHQMPAWGRRLSIEITRIVAAPLRDIPATASTWAQLRDRYGYTLWQQDSLMWQISYRNVELLDRARSYAVHPVGLAEADRVRSESLR